MNNKDNNENNNDLTSENSDVIDNQPQDGNQVSETSEPKPPQQGGAKLAGFGLFVALLALVTAGWLVYRVEVQSDDSNAVDQLAGKANQQDLNQLQTRVNQLEEALTKQTQAVEQNQQQITRLRQDLNKRPDIQFDDGLLKQHIESLQQQMTMLKKEDRQQANEPQTEEYLSALARSQTIHALKTVQLLLDQQQLPQAVQILKQWRNNEYLPLAVQTRLQQLITTLSNTETPDEADLRQQLAKLKDNITALSLTTETQANPEPAWYERFITVKKIKPEQQSLNSADLQQLKANAGHQIQQAELALALKQPALWRDALQQAEQTLTQSTLDTESLQRQAQQLREQNIVTQIPANLGIQSLIDQLEDITE